MHPARHPVKVVLEQPRLERQRPSQRRRGALPPAAEQLGCVLSRLVEHTLVRLEVPLARALRRGACSLSARIHSELRSQ